MDKFNDWAELTVASVAAGSLVFAELGPHLTRFEPQGNAVAARGLTPQSH
jgi:hypothetical protein